MAGGSGFRPVDAVWMPIRLERGLCANWKDGPNDTQVRMGSHGAALRALARTYNHLSARTPRLLFNRVWKWGDGPTANADPILAWRVVDSSPNMRYRIYRGLSRNPESVDDVEVDHYWQRLDDSLVADGTCIGPRQHGQQTPIFPDIFEEAAIYDRGSTAPVTADHQEGLITYNDHNLVEFHVQEQQLIQLKEDETTWIDPGVPAEQEIATQQYLEDIVTKFHSLRSSALPLLGSYAAFKDNTAWATAAIPTSSGYGANAKGIHIDDNNFHNVLDGSTGASRSSTSPGFAAFVKLSGRGDELTATGERVGTKIEIYGYATVANGTVRVIGPDSITSNTVDITIGTGATPLWYNTANMNQVKFDSSIDYDSTATSRAKFDVFAQAGVGGELFIYGIFIRHGYL